jgi:hypothetical protein
MEMNESEGKLTLQKLHELISQINSCENVFDNMKNISEFYFEICERLNGICEPYSYFTEEEDITKVHWKISDGNFVIIYDANIFNTYNEHENTFDGDSIKISLEIFEKLKDEDIYDVITVFLKRLKEKYYALHNIRRNYAMYISLRNAYHTHIQEYISEIE